MHQDPISPPPHPTRCMPRPLTGSPQCQAVAVSSVHRPRRWERTLAGVMAAALLLIVGCGAGSRIPNPFSSAEATPAAPVAPPPAAPTVAPVPARPTAQPTSAFAPFWVKNHQLTEMWSGPSATPGNVSFGTTSQQFCSFQVVLPREGERLYVFNPYSQNYFWIDSTAVGPVGPPEQRPGAWPPEQNCSEILYTE